MKIFWFWTLFVAALLNVEVFVRNLKTNEKSPNDKISGGDANKTRQKRYIVYGGGHGQRYGYGSGRPYGQPDFPLDKLVRVREGMRREWSNIAQGIPDPDRPHITDLQQQAYRLTGYN